MSDEILPDHLVAKLRFRHLQLLTLVQAHGSLRAASQALNLTQPALSKALSEIESAFGYKLFVRSARGLTPTVQGAAVLRGAALLLEELVHLRAEAGMAGRYGARIRIGAPPFVAQTYLPDVVGKLVRRELPMRVQLHEDRVPALTDALQRGKLDALITTLPLQMMETGAGSLQYTRLFEVRFAVIAASKHPVFQATRIDWARLMKEQWVMQTEGSMGRKLIEDCFTHAGVPVPVPLIESTSPTTTLQLVAAGLGIGMVPDVFLFHHRVQQEEAVRRIPVVPEPYSSVVALVVRQGPLSDRLALLKEALGV